MSEQKNFLKMSRAERDAEAKKWEGEVSFDETRPMSKRSQALWELAKRGRGRPRKPASERARRVLISLDPNVLAAAEAFALAQGLDRSKLFALSVQAYIEATKGRDTKTARGRTTKKPWKASNKKAAKSVA